MIDWQARARVRISETAATPTDKTDERGVSSVLSVPPERIREERDGVSSVLSVPPTGLRGKRDPWTEGEIRRFSARIGLFLRRGIHATDADDLAERLLLRDRDGDDRRLCLECANLSGRADRAWRCTSTKTAGVGAELPRELVTMQQRCPAFAAAGPSR